MVSRDTEVVADGYDDVDDGSGTPCEVGCSAGCAAETSIAWNAVFVSMAPKDAARLNAMRRCASFPIVN